MEKGTGGVGGDNRDEGMWRMLIKIEDVVAR